MENASKALIIAGSVFLSILIITALVFTFNQIGDLKKTEASAEEEKILAQYNKKIERFNKSGLYGSEILSLANYVEDYNIRQSDLKGYKAISLNIYIKAISDATYFKKEKYTDYKELVNSFKNLEKEVNRLQNQQYCGETVKKLAGLTTEVLENYINSTTKIMHRCLKHNICWKTIPSRALRGIGCEKCHSEKISMSKYKYKSTDDYILDVNNISPHIDVLEEYIDLTTPILHFCKNGSTRALGSKPLINVDVCISLFDSISLINLLCSCSFVNAGLKSIFKEIPLCLFI